MDTKQITVGVKSFTIRELKAVELDDIDFTDRKLSVKKQVQLSTGISDDDYSNLSVKERLTIIKVINELNGFNENFQ